MGTHVLLNLLNDLGKSDKMRGLPSILSLFRNKFNKFNNAWAQMLDSIYHMMLKFVEIGILVWKHLRDVVMSVIHNVTKFCKPLVVYRF